MRYRKSGEPANCFHEYVYARCRQARMCFEDLQVKLAELGCKVSRQWTWDLSKRPALQIGKQESLLEKTATILSEPMSKLAFLAGRNPWATRLPLPEQLAIWEFIERTVAAHEQGQTKPSDVAYVRMMNALFGGAESVVEVSNEAMAELLRPQDDDGTA